MNVRTLAKQMVGYTANIPGTKSSKALVMVRQIEIETRTAGVGEQSKFITGSLGDVPCLFGTLTTQRYQ